MSVRMSYDLDVENRQVVATVLNDKDVVETREYPTTGLGEEIASKVFLYGWSKLLQDRANSHEVGIPRLNGMSDVSEQLMGGKWEKERKYSPRMVSLFEQAVAKVQGIDVVTAQKSLARYSEEEREQIKANARIQEAMEEIRSTGEETSQEAPDLGALL